MKPCLCEYGPEENIKLNAVNWNMDPMKQIRIIKSLLKIRGEIYLWPLVMRAVYYLQVLWRIPLNTSCMGAIVGDKQACLLLLDFPDAAGGPQWETGC